MYNYFCINVINVIEPAKLQQDMRSRIKTKWGNEIWGSGTQNKIYKLAGYK